MARTTVEDCMQQCDNRFNLAFHVSLRARDIQRRGDQKVDIRDDKALVVALREIKDGLTEIPKLAEKAGDEMPTLGTTAVNTVAAHTDPLPFGLPPKAPPLSNLVPPVPRNPDGTRPDPFGADSDLDSEDEEEEEDENEDDSDSDFGKPAAPDTVPDGF